MHSCHSRERTLLFVFLQLEPVRRRALGLLLTNVRPVGREHGAIALDKRLHHGPPSVLVTLRQGQKDRPSQSESQAMHDDN